MVVIVAVSMSVVVAALACVLGAACRSRREEPAAPPAGTGAEETAVVPMEHTPLAASATVPELAYIGPAITYGAALRSSGIWLDPLDLINFAAVDPPFRTPRPSNSKEKTIVVQ